MCKIKKMGGMFLMIIKIKIEKSFVCLLKGERVLSFIPPDGNFRLISYHIGSQK